MARRIQRVVTNIYMSIRDALQSFVGKLNGQQEKWSQDAELKRESLADQYERVVWFEATCHDRSDSTESCFSHVGTNGQFFHSACEPLASYIAAKQIPRLPNLDFGQPVSTPLESPAALDQETDRTSYKSTSTSPETARSATLATLEGVQTHPLLGLGPIDHASSPCASQRITAALPVQRDSTAHLIQDADLRIALQATASLSDIRHPTSLLPGSPPGCTAVSAKPTTRAPPPPLSITSIQTVETSPASPIIAAGEPKSLPAVIIQQRDSVYGTFSLVMRALKEGDMGTAQMALGHIKAAYEEYDGSVMRELGGAVES